LKKVLLFFFCLLLFSLFIFQCEAIWSETIITVGMITDTTRTLPSQRKVFFTGKYFFVFYSNGSHLVYQYSSNGFVWSSPVNVVSGIIRNNQFSVFFQSIYYGDFVALVYCGEGYDEPVKYVLGEISDSTISWGTIYKPISGFDVSFYRPCVVLAPFSASPAVSVTKYDEFEGVYSVIYAETSERDGSSGWKTKEWFTYSDYEPYTFPAVYSYKRTEYKVYFTYFTDGIYEGDLFYGKRLETPTKINTATFYYPYIVVTNWSTELYLFYDVKVAAGDYRIAYQKKLADDTWLDHKYVFNSSVIFAGLSASSYRIGSSNRVFLLFATRYVLNYTIYCLEMKADKWEAPLTLFVREPEDYPVNIEIPYHCDNKVLVLMFRELAAAPFKQQVVFADLRAEEIFAVTVVLTATTVIAGVLIAYWYRSKTKIKELAVP